MKGGADTVFLFIENPAIPFEDSVLQAGDWTSKILFTQNPIETVLNKGIIKLLDELDQGLDYLIINKLTNKLPRELIKMDLSERISKILLFLKLVSKKLFIQIIQEFSPILK